MQLINRQKQLNFWIKGIVLFTVLAWLCYLLFYNLDTLTIRLWDESRNAINSLEMYSNSKYLTKYYQGQPDMYELKPPLLVWTQVVFMHLVGINEWAVRLPSAISVLVLCFILYFTIIRYTKWFVGLISVLILVSLPGFMGAHIALFGDHDAMLCLFITLANLNFYRYSKEPTNTKYAFYFWLFLLLAWFTKSIVALFFAPAWFVFVLLAGRLLPILKSKTFYIGLFCFLLVPVVYYTMHEIATPGYVNEVWNHELFNRFAAKSPGYENKMENYFYYFKALPQRMGVWFYWLLLLLIPFKINEIQKKVYYLIICIFLTLAILSFGSKNFWYDAPIFPLMAMAIALRVEQIIAWIKVKFVSKAIFNYGIIAVLIAFISNALMENYKQIWNQDDWHSQASRDHTYYNLAYLLRSKTELSKYKTVNLLYDQFDGPIYFYAQQRKNQGYKIVEINHPKKGDLKELQYLTADKAIVKMADSVGYTSMPIAYNCFLLQRK